MAHHPQRAADRLQVDPLLVDHLQVVNHLRAADLLQVGNHPKAVGPHHPRAEHLLQADLHQVGNHQRAADLLQVANHPKVADLHHPRAEPLLQADLPQADLHQVDNHPKEADPHHLKEVDHHHKVNLQGDISSDLDLANLRNWF